VYVTYHTSLSAALAEAERRYVDPFLRGLSTQVEVSPYGGYYVISRPPGTVAASYWLMSNTTPSP